MKKIYFILLGIYILVLCFFVPSWGERTATFNIVMSLLLSFILTPLISMLIVFGLPSLVGEQQTEKQKAEDEELSQKHINENLEKVLDTVERQDDEDGISYLARCMREADKED